MHKIFKKNDHKNKFPSKKNCQPHPQFPRHCHSTNPHKRPCICFIKLAAVFFWSCLIQTNWGGSAEASRHKHSKSCPPSLPSLFSLILPPLIDAILTVTASPSITADEEAMPASVVLEINTAALWNNGVKIDGKLVISWHLLVLLFPL